MIPSGNRARLAHLPKWLLVALLVPTLTAAKCITHDPSLETEGAGGAPMSELPENACDEPGVAKLTVVDTAFRIECGCQETEGRECTIPVGTEVVWRFADAEEHNVSGPEIGLSPDILTGTFREEFNTPGTYDYECTLHGAMKGYRVVVLEP